MTDEKSDYDVGYGKPPKHTQFKPGESGNKKGRPKGGKNLKTDLQDELNETLAIVVDGKRRNVTKQRAFIKTIMAQAIQGNQKAAMLLFSMLLKLLPQEDEESGEIELTETDQAILNDFISSIKDSQSEETDTND